MNSFLGDIRYGTRVLLKRPGLSALAIVALAVGIGLTTTMFSIVYAAVIKGLPYEQSERLVAIFRNRPAQGIQFMQVSIHDFVDWREQQNSFEALAAPAGEMDVVLGSGWPGVMLHEAVGHGLEGDFNRKKTSSFAGLMGARASARPRAGSSRQTISGKEPPDIAASRWPDSACRWRPSPPPGSLPPGACVPRSFDRGARCTAREITGSSRC